MKYIYTVVLLAVAIGSSVQAETFQPPDPNTLPALMASVRITGSLEFCGEPVSLEDPEVRERLEKELLLTIWDRPQVVLWIKRSPRYLPLIEGRSKIYFHC
jgi:hypothetical protein